MPTCGKSNRRSRQCRIETMTLVRQAPLPALESLLIVRFDVLCRVKPAISRTPSPRSMTVSAEGVRPRSWWQRSRGGRTASWQGQPADSAPERNPRETPCDRMATVRAVVSKTARLRAEVVRRWIQLKLWQPRWQRLTTRSTTISSSRDMSTWTQASQTRPRRGWSTRGQHLGAGCLPRRQLSRSGGDRRGIRISEDAVRAAFAFYRRHRLAIDGRVALNE